MGRFLLLVAAFFEISAGACVTGDLSFQPQADGSFYSLVTLDDDAYTTQAASIPILKDRRIEIQSATNTDPIFLLKRQRKFFEGLPEFTDVIDLLIEGKIGRIDEITCFEETLINMVFSRFGIETELVAAVLTKAGNAPRVHLLSWAANGVQNSPGFDAKIDADIKAGWRMAIHFHNHPFFLNNSTGDIAGTVIPSQPDVLTYRNLREKWGLESAWVSNGFNTSKFKNTEFDLL